MRAKVAMEAGEEEVEKGFSGTLVLPVSFDLVEVF